jgi:dTDP-4-dehydrorhamnose 3,5-epimerase
MDKRGSFAQVWTYPELKQMGIRGDFLQLNQAKSSQGVLRGMHRQNQTKLVWPISGTIFDVALDVETGEHFGIELTPGMALFIPPQYAHGYLVVSSEAVVQYIVDAPYDKDLEEVFRWDKYGIEWPLTMTPLLSIKDANG